MNIYKAHDLAPGKMDYIEDHVLGSNVDYIKPLISFKKRNVASKGAMPQRYRQFASILFDF